MRLSLDWRSPRRSPSFPAGLPLHAGDFQTVKPIGWGGCVMTLFPIDGLPEPKVPGDMVEFTVPDLNGRPWADLWVKYFEQNMQRPAEQNDALAGFS